MSKGFCEGCQTCVGITSSGIPIGRKKPDEFTVMFRPQCYWRLDLHNDERPGTCHQDVPHPIYQETEECGETLPCKHHGWPQCSKSGDLI